MWKQVEDAMELNGCYRMKVDSEAFAVPILTASAFIIYDVTAVRIWIINALKLTFFYGNH